MKTVLTVIMACMCAYGWGANKTESEYLKKFKENISSCIKHNALEFKNINKDLAYYPPDSTEWKEAKIKKDKEFEKIINNK